MLIIFAVAVMLIGAKFAPRGEFFDDGFSREQTRALKGTFAVFVILHHLCTYLADTFASLLFFKYLGYLMVGGFFLISGYGLMHSVKSKPNYLKGFFKKRILSLLVPFYIINAGYLFLNYFLITDPAAFKNYMIRSLFGLHLWYVPVIIILYLAFFLSFKIFKEKYGHIAVTVFVVAFVTLFFTAYKCGILPSYGRWWYNSVPCFAVGIWYCRVKDSVSELVKKKYPLITAITVSAFLILFAVASERYQYDTAATLLLEIICVILFSLSVFLLSMKIKIGNPILNICGDLSFELYLSHALFITAFRWGMTVKIPFLNVEYLPYISNGDTYLCAILIASFFFSFCVHRISKFITKPIIKK